LYRFGEQIQFGQRNRDWKRRRVTMETAGKSRSKLVSRLRRDAEDVRRENRTSTVALKVARR
jgi:hypothetical protein